MLACLCVRVCNGNEKGRMRCGIKAANVYKTHSTNSDKCWIRFFFAVLLCFALPYANISIHTLFIRHLFVCEAMHMEMKTILSTMIFMAGPHVVFFFSLFNVSTSFAIETDCWNRVNAINAKISAKTASEFWIRFKSILGVFFGPALHVYTHVYAIILRFFFPFQSDLLELIEINYNP